jgi:hypothetical protein
MPTILDLFKDQKKDLYGKSEAIRIDSKGLINPPRGVALLASSPSKLGDLIGNQIAGAVGGSANRPSDTIFRGKGLLSKPISLFKTPEGLRNAVDADTTYFLKSEPPSPNSIIATIKQGASNPLGVAANVGIDLLKSLPFKKGDLLGLKDRNPKRGLPYSKDKKFSDNYDLFTNSNVGIPNVPEKFVVSEIKERNSLGQKKTWNNANDYILSKESLEKDTLKDKLKEFDTQNQVWVTFKKYGNNEIIPFNGTITGISEDITPEWNNFKYLGSPFKSYRYLGVERTLNFELKLYYNKEDEKNVMIKKINYLKSLAFPYEQISEISYGTDTNQQTSQYAFSPNLVTLNIGDMYKNIFGFIETLSFSVDDNTSWPNFNYNMELAGNNTLYPSVVAVTIGMKIIENHTTETSAGITKYKYDFDGRGIDGIIKETNEQIQDTAKAASLFTTPILPGLPKFSSDKLLGSNKFNKKR